MLHINLCQLFVINVLVSPLTQKRFQALYSYTAADADEVSLQEGDLVLDVERIDEGWVFGCNQRTGQRGMLPANYVRPVWDKDIRQSAPDLLATRLRSPSTHARSYFSQPGSALQQFLKYKTNLSSAALNHQRTSREKHFMKKSLKICSAFLQPLTSLLLVSVETTHPH